MFDTPTAQRTYQGAWREVLSHRDEIPETSEVEVRIPDSQSDADDALGGKTLADLFEGRLGVLDFEPADLARRAEEYLANGFGALPNAGRDIGAAQGLTLDGAG